MIEFRSCSLFRGQLIAGWKSLEVNIPWITLISVGVNSDEDKHCKLWITICLCNYLIPQSSMSEVEHCVLYFIRRICLSISSTWSCAAVVITSSRPTLCLTFSHSISIRTRLVTNPTLVYKFMVFIRYLSNFPAVQVGAYLQVINPISREKVTRNGIPFTNITSNIKVQKNVHLIKVLRTFLIFLLHPFLVSV